MDIIESKLTGKVSHEHNEDSLLISNNFIAVIDGVTLNEKIRYRNKTTGKLASELVMGVFTDLSPQASWKDFAHTVNEAYENFYRGMPFPYSRTFNGLQAMAAVYSKARSEIWLIGDCHCQINGQSYRNPIAAEDVLIDFRRLVNDSLMEEQKIQIDTFFKRKDPALDYINPWANRLKLFANHPSSPWGYSILNGSAIPAHLVKIIDVPRASSVALASNGYPSLKSSLQETEDQLTAIVDKDPYAMGPNRTLKYVPADQLSYDDRAYIRFKTE